MQSSQRVVRNNIAYTTLIGSKWTAVTALDHEKYFVVTAWANTFTDCDGAPDSVVIESADSGRRRIIAWRALRDRRLWRQGWS